MRRRIFIKQMTPAEAGDTKTHEKYVRLPNNFDYQSFFQQEGITNGSVIQVDFDAAYNGDQNDVIPLKFVYYASSNQEKRIPSLGPIFDKYNVTSSDVVYLESRTENGRTSFSISFKKDSELRIFTSPIVYEIEDVEDDIQKQAIALNDAITNQIIYYGAPGTGKSHKIKEKLAGVSKENIFRTTFHPDSDYSTFVGCYKPSPVGFISNYRYRSLQDLKSEADVINSSSGDKVSQIINFVTKYANDLQYIVDTDPNIKSLQNLLNKNLSFANETYLAYVIEYVLSNQETRITYKFCPQVFTNAYIKAWEDTSKPVYLIIEEINRGNCAQIFGDLFQLLDRDKTTGKSEYPIKADKDLVDHIEKLLGVGHEGIKNDELCLPPNLIIYATMNTSDQSLFPMDSAFKRRWDWVYVPIEYDEKKSDGTQNESYNFTITIGEKDNEEKYRWVNFLKKVNDKIYDATKSEDKQMGNFFIKKSIKANEFVNKVMFYLWNEVCKEEYETKRNFFRKDKEGKIEFKFTELFGDNQATILKEFMTSLGVEPIEKKTEEPAAE